MFKISILCVCSFVIFWFIQSMVFNNVQCYTRQEQENNRSDRVRRVMQNNRKQPRYFEFDCVGFEKRRFSCVLLHAPSVLTGSSVVLKTSHLKFFHIL